jgi:SpoVK/Ycf46/Vps4 family AAA+-type ATPase
MLKHSESIFDSFNIVLPKSILEISPIVNEISEQISSFVNFNETNKPKQFKQKGILITGKPGTGKTYITKKIAECSELPFLYISCPDLFKSISGESEANLYSIFKRLSLVGPSILILDEIEIIAPNNIVANPSLNEYRIFSTLLWLLDCLEGKIEGQNINNIFVIGITNAPYNINPKLTQSLRLDKIFELTIKTPEQRYLLLKELTKTLSSYSDLDSNHWNEMMEFVSKKTHGFVTSDLENICLKVALEFININKMNKNSVDEKLWKSLFEKAIKETKPAGLVSYMNKNIEIKFSDLYGIDDAINTLKSSVIYPIQCPEDFEMFGISPPKGILIYGPPGVGKTSICCALAYETGFNLITIEGSSIRSKVVGESEKSISKLFAAARENSPCIILIDQIENLITKRGSSNTSENSGDRIIASFLTEMDGIYSKKSIGYQKTELLIIGATSHPDKIDSAILRPGRLDELVYISPPDINARREILKGKLRNIQHSLSSNEIDIIADKTEYFSGIDKNIKNDAIN